MEQPKKGKSTVKSVKVVGTGNLNGDYIDLTTKEAEARGNVKKNAKEKPKEIEKIHGIVKNKEGRFEAKKYEKKYIPGDEKRGIKPKIVSEGTGQVVKVPKNRNFKEFRKEFVRDSTNTANRRQSNADYYNFQTRDESNSASARMASQKATSEKQMADERDKKILRDAQLAAKRSK